MHRGEEAREAGRGAQLTLILEARIVTVDNAARGVLASGEKPAKAHALYSSTSVTLPFSICSVCIRLEVGDRRC